MGAGDPDLNSPGEPTDARAQGAGSPGPGPLFAAAAAGGREPGLGRLQVSGSAFLPRPPPDGEEATLRAQDRRGGPSLEERWCVELAGPEASCAPVVPPPPHPHGSKPRSASFPSAARPARSAAVEGAGSPSLLSPPSRRPLHTHSRNRPSSTANTRRSSAQPNHCLFSEALARQTHTTESQAEPSPTTATQLEYKIDPLPVSPPPAATSQRRARSLGQRGALVNQGRSRYGVGHCASQSWVHAGLCSLSEWGYTQAEA